MEAIISTPGLQHLAENIIWDLNDEAMKIFAQINQSCSQILQNPIFGLRKFEHLSRNNQKDWIKVIQSVKNSDKGIAIISYLQWYFNNNALMDFPCYSNLKVQQDFRIAIKVICKSTKSSKEDLEFVKIMAPLTDNLNAPNKHRETPIYLAAYRGHTEIVKILAPLVDNPNAPDNFGRSPIYYAAKFGHTEIVKILAPLIDNPNTPNYFGRTPIHYAAKYGYMEIVKILASLTENPNAPDGFGRTPIYYAAKYGYIENIKILTPLADNLNAQNEFGRTPIYYAAKYGYMEIVKILSPLTDNPNAPDDFGYTPIYYAAKYGYIEIVKILAPLTDNPNAPNEDGKTPSTVTKNSEIRSFLKSFNTSRKHKAESLIKPSKKRAKKS